MTEEMLAEAFTQEELEEIGRESDRMQAEIAQWFDTHQEELTIK